MDAVKSFLSKGLVPASSSLDSGLEALLLSLLSRDVLLEEGSGTGREATWLKLGGGSSVFGEGDSEVAKEIFGGAGILPAGAEFLLP